MKTFACGEVVPGCDAELVCDTEDELMTALAAHAADAHGLTSLPPELVERVRRAAGFGGTPVGAPVQDGTGQHGAGQHGTSQDASRQDGTTEDRVPGTEAQGAPPGRA